MHSRIQTKSTHVLLLLRLAAFLPEDIHFGCRQVRHNPHCHSHPQGKKYCPRQCAQSAVPVLVCRKHSLAILSPSNSQNPESLFHNGTDHPNTDRHADFLSESQAAKSYRGTDEKCSVDAVVKWNIASATDYLVTLSFSLADTRLMACRLGHCLP